MFNLTLSPPRKVKFTIFNGFTPQPPKGGEPINQQLVKSPPSLHCRGGYAEARGDSSLPAGR